MMKPEDLTYVEHNKIVYKGIQLKVTPEFIQDSIANSISQQEIMNHIQSLYDKELEAIRDYKINTIINV